HPAPQHRRVEFGHQLHQDPDLRSQVLLAGDHRERVGVQDRQQLLVREAEERLQRGDAQKSWFSPPKTSETESSVKMRRIESVSRSATESTVMLSGAFGRSGIVSVTTIRSNGLAARVS